MKSKHPPDYDKRIPAAMLSRFASGSQHLATLRVLIASDGQVQSQSGLCLWLVRRRSSTMQKLSQVIQRVFLVLNHRWLPVDFPQISSGI